MSRNISFVGGHSSPSNDNVFTSNQALEMLPRRALDLIAVIPVSTAPSKSLCAERIRRQVAGTSFTSLLKAMDPK
jgi:hypothetical protein